MRDGAPFGPEVVLSGGSGDHLTAATWAHTWPNLPKYKADGSGEESVYTVHEKLPVPHFQSFTDGATIFNVYRPGDFTAKKLWEGLKEAPRGNLYQVKLDLYQTILDDTTNYSKLIGSAILNGIEDENPTVIKGDITYQETIPWEVTFLNLPASGLDERPGSEGGLVNYSYEIRESDVISIVSPGDEAPFVVDTQASASTFVTNRYTKTTFTAKKDWKDGPTQRPAITFVLLQDGQPYGEPGILDGKTDGSPDNGSGEHQPWTYTWEGLPRFKNAAQELHVYSFREEPIENYEQEYVDGDIPQVTNTYRVPLGEVNATKKWLGGPTENKTEVTLLLYRQTPDMAAPERVLTPVWISHDGAPEMYRYTWTNIELTDIKGQPYTFTVWEEGEDGGRILVSGYHYQVVYGTIQSNELKVDNTFLPPAPYTHLISAKKTLTGGKLDEGQFTFVLTDHEGLEHEATNTARGSVLFPAFIFDAPGTYAFTLKEKAGTAPGMRYDPAIYGLTLTLDINENNALVLTEETWDKDGETIELDSPTFSNTYELIVPTYPTIKVPLEVKKFLKNGSLKGGEFTFALYDAAGRELARATNNQDGSVTFPERSFSREVSNYLYTVKELPGTSKSIAYDKTVYTVKVTTRAQNGRLTFTLAYEKDGVPFAGSLAFTNVRKLPKTGDEAPLKIGLVALLGLLTAWMAKAMGKRKKHGNQR